MINSASERQGKSSDELMRRLIEERDGKNLLILMLILLLLLALLILLKPIQTSGTLAGGTTMLNPSAQSMNHFHSQTTTDGSAPTFGMLQQTMTSMFRQRYMHTTPSFSMPNHGLAPYTPGVMAEHTQTTMAITKPFTPP
jgi:hypothetical protein